MRTRSATGKGALRPLAIAALLAGLPSSHAAAQRVPDGFTVQTLASGLSAPVAFEFLPDGGVLYAEQLTGQVRLFREGSGVQPVAVLSVPDLVAGDERGLLGLALDPAFPDRRYLYVYYNVATPNRIRIARYTLLPDRDLGIGEVMADPGSRYDLIDDIPDQTPEHNGGTLRFGVDGLLYAGIGEDGTPCAAQDSTSLRGVILRLRTIGLPPGPGRAFRAQITPADNPFAVAADSNLRLVAALGLRNPFRFQVDPWSGTLVIGDVGENVREEIDLLSPPLPGFDGPSRAIGSGAPLGADFGWPWLEGTIPGVHRNDCGPVPAGLTAPAFDYDRSAQLGGAAIISAGVYRPVSGGARNWAAGYSGDLFASDYYSGALRRITFTGDAWAIAPPVAGQPAAGTWGDGFNEVSDWRLGPDGALWFCRQSLGFAAGTGSLGRIAGPGGPPPPTHALVVEVLGSPAVGSAVFRFAADLARPARLTLHDLSGRIIRRWSSDEFARTLDGLRVNWDGRDAGGDAVRPGLYVARLESGGRTSTVRVPFLR
jgi:glucose/arabinose dehydrogenase